MRWHQELCQWWASWRSSGERAERRQRRTRLVLEFLEDRTCPSVSATGAAQAQLTEAYGQLPLSFEANQGQTDARVNFLSRGAGYALFLTRSEAVLSLQQSAPASGQASAASDVLAMRLIGARAAAQPVGLEPRSGVSNYLIGSDPSAWHTDVAEYGRVLYPNVYAGIDLAYYGNQQQLEYDFTIAPGADAGAIRLAFEGADGVSLDAAGNLVLHASGGDVVEHAPVVYQELQGVRQAVAGQYVIGNDGQVGFQVGAYDHSQPLVIDPVLSYSTYLGGSNSDEGYGIAVDQAGNAYVTGSTVSTDFPTTTGALQTHLRGDGDAFVTKLNATGTALIYSTYLGGASGSSFGGSSFGVGIAVDAAGNAYVAGHTTCTDFPTTPGAFNRTLQNPYDPYGYVGFVAKLNTAGTGLVYSTYLNGGIATGIALDSAGSAYVAGSAGASFPVTAGAAYAAGTAFAAKLLPDGSGLAYSTRLGVYVVHILGSQTYVHVNDTRIAVDGAGNAYLTGTNASVYPNQAFAMKLNAAGSARLYFTSFGGHGQDIAVDAAGNAYVLVHTLAPSTFATTAGAYRTTQGAGTDTMAVAKLRVDGAGQPDLAYATFLGDGTPEAIAVNSATGVAYVTGYTYVADPGPTADGWPQGAVLVRGLSADGSALVYSTYLGGPDDSATALAVDPSGAVYLTGGADPGFPTTANAFQPNWDNYYDAFVAKIAFPDPAAPTATVSVPSTSLVRGQPATYILGVTANSDPAAVFSFQISWGDGTSQTVAGPSGTRVDHIYTACGTFGSTYVVQASGTAPDGTPLQPVTGLVPVRPWVMEGNTLVVGGTTGTDKILITPADSTGTSVRVSINGVLQLTSQAAGQIVVFGQAGNDTIQIQSARINKVTVYVAIPAVLFGGSGSHTLNVSGSTANNVLIGGAGSDALTGGRGRDLLIGGGGPDTLTAGSGDDILIGGSTSYDLLSPTMTFAQQLSALNAIMAEWGSSDPYATRVRDLQNGGGLNGSAVLNGSTIIEDSTVIDTLVGAASPALDWFLVDAVGKDVVRTARTGETITKI